MEEDRYSNTGMCGDRHHDGAWSRVGYGHDSHRHPLLPSLLSTSKSMGAGPDGSNTSSQQTPTFQSMQLTPAKNSKFWAKGPGELVSI